MGNFNFLFQIEFPYLQKNMKGFSQILQSQKRLIDCKVDIPNKYDLNHILVSVNSSICFFRQRILGVIKAMMVIQRHYPRFWLRREIIYELLKDMKMNIKNLEKILLDLFIKKFELSKFTF